MRKRRTREHIIADLSANYVERFILRSGHTVQRFGSDYGYDLFLTTFDASGEVENGIVFLQLKATDNLRRRDDGTPTFVVDTRDLELWCREEIPVILIIYDAQQEVAYWYHVQENFTPSSVPTNQGTLTVAIPPVNGVDEVAIAYFRQLKQQAFVREVIE